MANIQKTVELLNMLPEEDISFVNKLITKLIRAWDPDFTKLTKNEAIRLKEAEEQIRNGEVFSDKEVWDE